MTTQDDQLIIIFTCRLGFHYPYHIVHHADIFQRQYTHHIIVIQTLQLCENIVKDKVN